jgi:hypothetical protein
MPMVAKKVMAYDGAPFQANDSLGRAEKSSSENALSLAGGGIG